MAIKRISPTEAKALLDQGYLYLDVRSVPEYEQGHPPGAHNAPLLHYGPGGLTPNAEFVSVVARAYSRDARMVIGCESGVRSQRAALLLEATGFTQLFEMRGGWQGEEDMFGRLEKGWARLGLPLSTESTPGGSWAELRARTRPID